MEVGVHAELSGTLPGPWEGQGCTLKEQSIHLLAYTLGQGILERWKYGCQNYKFGGGLTVGRLFLDPKCGMKIDGTNIKPKLKM